MFHESNDNVARVFSMEILANEAQWTFVTTPIYCTPFDPTCNPILLLKYICSKQKALRGGNTCTHTQTDL